jgi:hypothetical protein
VLVAPPDARRARAPAARAELKRWSIARVFGVCVEKPLRVTGGRERWSQGAFGGGRGRLWILLFAWSVWSKWERREEGALFLRALGVKVRVWEYQVGGSRGEPPLLTAAAASRRCRLHPPRPNAPPDVGRRSGDDRDKTPLLREEILNPTTGAAVLQRDHYFYRLFSIDPHHKRHRGGSRIVGHPINHPLLQTPHTRDNGPPPGARTTQGGGDRGDRRRQRAARAPELATRCPSGQAAPRPRARSGGGGGEGQGGERRRRPNRLAPRPRGVLGPPRRGPAWSAL